MLALHSRHSRCMQFSIEHYFLKRGFSLARFTIEVLEML